jgi:hypothetical protein
MLRANGHRTLMRWLRLELGGKSESIANFNVEIGFGGLKEENWKLVLSLDPRSTA